MIIDAILGLLATVVSWILGLLPHLAVPSWLSGLSSQIATITAGLSGTTGWVPWSLLFLAVGLALAAALVSVAIRGFRIATETRAAASASPTARNSSDHGTQPVVPDKPAVMVAIWLESPLSHEGTARCGSSPRIQLTTVASSPRIASIITCGPNRC